MSTENEQPAEVREIDPSALKGLAHPLRMAIYDVLSMYGPQTATSLARRLGESSGSTSYHLRQLARHRFIREVEGESRGREKWWERTPGPVEVPRQGDDQDPSTRTAAHYIHREWTRNMTRALEDFIDVADDGTRMASEWADAAVISASNLRLTSEQLSEIVAEHKKVTQAFIDEYRGRNDPGSRPVQIQFNAFPLIDGEEAPS